MNVENLIHSYGFLTVIVGTFFEGETVLILAAFSAHQGYLPLSEVILAAFVGTLAGDQFYFYLGRRHSLTLLGRRPSWKSRIDRANRLLVRFQTAVILSSRFLYGLRTVFPFAIGMSSVPTGKFLILNVIGAAVWSTSLGYGGYYFGHALQMALRNAKTYEFWVLGLIAVIGILVWGIALLRRRSHSSTIEPQDPEENQN
jgi:membrane protein DedA with SNARE-associated domain